jgi:EKC/KEOPS complex subunit CGI121/TPRKB
MVQKVNLAHVPPDLAIYAALYTDVENARFLKEQLLAGNSDFEYAFIDASVVGNRLRL